MPLTEQIVYFEDTAKAEENTRAVVALVGEYLKRGDARYVVLATNTGYVGAQFAPLAKAHPEVTFIGVKMAPAVDKIYDITFSDEHLKVMQGAGMKLVCGTHALTGGVDRALRAKFQGYPPSAVMAETLYLFSQGMKVCVEIIAMAADAGLLPEGEQVVSCAGTGHGSDTVIAAASAASANLFELDIHRVLAMPLKR